MKPQTSQFFISNCSKISNAWMVDGETHISIWFAKTQNIFAKILKTRGGCLCKWVIIKPSVLLNNSWVLLIFCDNFIVENNYIFESINFLPCMVNFSGILNSETSRINEYLCSDFE